MEDAVKQILKAIGEDPGREGLIKTPERVAKSLKYLSNGYQKDPRKVVNGALFSAEGYDELIVCRDIAFFSMCEHHMLPFFGRCHVAYIPGEKIVGLSKMPRLVEVFARRLQVQERLTEQIADAMEEIIQPKGVGVVMQALHMCVAMRGVENPSAVTTTQSLRGVVKSDADIRREFLSSIDLGGNIIQA